MRRLVVWGFVLVFVMALPVCINSAEAKDVWKTYKLIKNGDLDTSKWRFNDRQIDGVSIVTPSIDGDRVKFEHRPNTDPASGGGSAWLQLIKNPECVKGIKVEITMGTDGDAMPLDGHFRARIGNTAGAYGSSGDYVWNQIGLRNRLSENGGDRVFGAMDLEDPMNNYDWIYDLIYSQFNHPEEVDGSTYELTLILDRKKRTVQYSVEGFGTVTYKMPEKLLPGWENFWGIGTRSNDALGSGTVWFGNKVKVLVDTKCKPDKKNPIVKKSWPKDGEKNVAVDIDEIKVQFNEEMNWRTSGCEDSSCCPYAEVRNPLTGAYEFATYLCEFEYDPSKNFVITKEEADPDLLPSVWYKVTIPSNYFWDLAGNGNKGYTFKFKTQNPTF